MNHIHPAKENFTDYYDMEEKTWFGEFKNARTDKWTAEKDDMYEVQCHWKALLLQKITIDQKLGIIGNEYGTSIKEECECCVWFELENWRNHSNSIFIAFSLIESNVIIDYMNEYPQK